MQKYYRDVKDRMVNEGRRESDCAILSGFREVPPFGLDGGAPGQ